MECKPKRYERIGQMMIRPLLFTKEKSAYDLARLFYAQYSNLSFKDDLEEYMRHGYVVTRPNLFVMIRPIFHEGERIWFIRIVVGNLAEAITTLPCYLPKVAFCRNNQADKMVVVDTMRAIQLSMKLNDKHGIRPSTNGEQRVSSGDSGPVASGIRGRNQGESSFDRQIAGAVDP